MIDFNLVGSIRREVEKIKALKQYEREIFILAGVFIFGTLAFGLGRLSKIEGGKIPVKIEIPNSLNSSKGVIGEGAISLEEFPPSVGLLVASRNGSKYHFPWCPGALQISEANKIWFQSEEQAEKAGYEPAANCKGL